MSTPPTTSHDVQVSVRRAVADQLLTQSAADNIYRWLNEPAYAPYRTSLVEHIVDERWQQLDDSFWTVIPFGTGGRRGRMYPIGCNAINDRTIGESAQGLAEYVLKQRATSSTPPACAIAYDTRHNSRRFAELCAAIMAANGFRVYFLDGCRSTPELSFLVRYKQCDCGIMVTASHNPPSDNAVKIYGATGGQVLPPHDQGIIDCVLGVAQIQQGDFATAVASGQIQLCSGEIDSAFVASVLRFRTAGPRELKILYSPLHGVGESAVVPVLTGDGFAAVELYEPQRAPDGDFPNVPGHVANPENAQVFDALTTHAQPSGADLALATDPDCDRVGAAAPKSRSSKAEWGTFTGNQLAALLSDFVCDKRRQAGKLTGANFLVTTLVTTRMVRRIGESYGVRVYDNLHVGFKWIAQQIDAAGAANFLLGVEESHGFLLGDYVRDKDGAAGCMLLAELAAEVKSKRQTLHDKLDALYWQHGYHGERQFNFTLAGSAGMARLTALMQAFRQQPPREMGGLAVATVEDYQSLRQTSRDGVSTPLDAASADMVILLLAEPGNYVAIRPSGTEPKVKFYLFTFVPAEQLHDLESTKQAMADRLTHTEAELRKFADAV